MDTSFSCVGCGKCCMGHHVPLTLAEAREWALDGGQIIILAEGFLQNGIGILPEQRQHAQSRSCDVISGETRAFIAITFAAYNLDSCRHLDEDLRCRIYDRRPLVCRIYPMEINPHIPLRQASKDCPPEAWLQGEALIVSDRLVDSETQALIERSRQADREDVHIKASICNWLGIATSALKGDGFTAYLPDMSAFTSALELAGQFTAEEHAEAAVSRAWQFHVSDEDVLASLQQAGAQAITGPSQYYGFIGLRAA
ncbi:zinc/iron-chelating domain-containing protein [Dickeya fangzhongdai]|uniref:YkgJ family cysteine cluster protein n=1 Tax=Dickeya fangzhongdai TaxID=1778540 RepID=UPI000EADC76B|nr:YkgJ family cysteine cluster protein [Dickeya fangzhongdai]AYH48950.1 zinc/iron-chelating domain-containing protein [Dickeya fangzhongdai]UMB75584.1 YkgJ family cysteine cluster protein [Dickeya fangzhongdai]